ncbi:hypothetical protein ES703_34344 [subsurface metagenome]
MATAPGPGNVFLDARGTAGKPVQGRGLLDSLWLDSRRLVCRQDSVIQVAVSRV